MLDKQDLGLSQIELGTLVDALVGKINANPIEPSSRYVTVRTFGRGDGAVPIPMPNVEIEGLKNEVMRRIGFLDICELKELGAKLSNAGFCPPRILSTDYHSLLSKIHEAIGYRRGVLATLASKE